MQKSRYKNHPMNDAEAALQAMGIKHAPVQGFTECSDVDGRSVMAFDPPGPYYLFGFESGIERGHPNREKIQVVFWKCSENAREVAKQIGWDLEKIEPLPVIDYTGKKPKTIGSTTAAYFSMPKVMMAALQEGALALAS